MMIDLPKIIHQFAMQGEAIRALADTFSAEQAAWKPDAKTWSLKELMEHLYNEERLDFRRHIKKMFGEPQPPEERITVDTCDEALEGFIEERQASLCYLSDLSSPDWGIKKTFRFGPDETMTLSAGDMLVSWVEHDILHLRQMVELMHACNAREASADAVTYAGGW